MTKILIFNYSPPFAKGGIRGICLELRILYFVFISGTRSAGVVLGAWILER